MPEQRTVVGVGVEGRFKGGSFALEGGIDTRSKPEAKTGHGAIWLGKFSRCYFVSIFFYKSAVLEEKKPSTAGALNISCYSS